MISSGFAAVVGSLQSVVAKPITTFLTTMPTKESLQLSRVPWSADCRLFALEVISRYLLSSSSSFGGHVSISLMMVVVVAVVVVVVVVAAESSHRVFYDGSKKFWSQGRQSLASLFAGFLSFLFPLFVPLFEFLSSAQTWQWWWRKRQSDGILSAKVGFKSLEGLCFLGSELLLINSRWVFDFIQECVIEVCILLFLLSCFL